MKIDHVALYVKDLEGVKAFFVQYFNATAGGKYHNRKTGFQSYFLSFAAGARLEIMTREEVTPADGAPYPAGYHHLSFSVGSPEAVDRFTDTLRQAGYAVVSGPRTTGDGYYESCVAGPEGLLVEITC